MKRKWKGLLAVFLAVMLMASCSVAGAVDGSNPDAIEENPEEDWDSKLYKAAEERLDEKYHAEVTLQIPSQETPLETDVVFVLDKSESMRSESMDLLDKLKEQIEGKDAVVKVGVVIFNKKANDMLPGLKDLVEDYDAIKAAIENDTIKSGTNTHAGLLKGLELLSQGHASNDRKYLIFVSDGITYIYNAEPTSIAVAQYEIRNKAYFYTLHDDMTTWEFKYPDGYEIGDFASFFNKVGPMITADGSTYEVEYGTAATAKAFLKSNYSNGKPIFDDKLFGEEVLEGDESVFNHVIGQEKALYLTNQVFRSAQNEGIQCYAVKKTPSSAKKYPWGPEFMDYLADGKEVDFTGIGDDMGTLYGEGSVVTDVIGFGDSYSQNGEVFNKSYDFDFVNDPAMLTLVYDSLDGQVEYHAVKISENVYGFVPHENGVIEREAYYDFVLTYYPNEPQVPVYTGDENVESYERFTLTFNRDILLGESIQLFYSVELMNPTQDPGMYTELETNKVAYIVPEDCNDQVRDRDYFPVPETSYENIGVVKKWAGDNDSAVRPSALFIDLVNKEDGKTKDEIKLNKDNDWTGKFLNIREGDYPDERFSLANYSRSREFDEEKNIYTFTNTYDAPAPVYDYTTVTITKIWDDNGYGGRPGSIKVKLGVENDPNYEGYTVKLSKDNPNVRIDGNTWTWSATIIDRNYYAEELYVDGYASKVEEVQPNQFVITNTYMPATGDDTPVTRYLLMLGGAALLIAAACVLRARKKA